MTGRACQNNDTEITALSYANQPDSGVLFGETMEAEYTDHFSAEMAAEGDLISRKVILSS